MYVYAKRGFIQDYILGEVCAQNGHMSVLSTSTDVWRHASLESYNCTRSFSIYVFSF